MNLQSQGDGGGRQGATASEGVPQGSHSRGSCKVKQLLFPSTFAGGFKELLRMPMRSQGYCGDGRGLSCC